MRHPGACVCALRQNTSPAKKKHKKKQKKTEIPRASGAPTHFTRPLAYLSD